MKIIQESFRNERQKLISISKFKHQKHETILNLNHKTSKFPWKLKHFPFPNNKLSPISLFVSFSHSNRESFIECILFFHSHKHTLLMSLCYFPTQIHPQQPHMCAWFTIWERKTSKKKWMKICTATWKVVSLCATALHTLKNERKFFYLRIERN